MTTCKGHISKKDPADRKILSLSGISIFVQSSGAYSVCG